MDITTNQYIIRHVTISLTGRVDAFNAPVVRQKLDALVAKGMNRFVIDLSDVQFLDSAGLAVLVSLLKRTQQEGGDVKLVLPREKAAGRILHLTRFDQVFEIVKTAEAALGNF